MKRLYSPKEKDQIYWEFQEAQDEVQRLKAKPYLSEKEYQSLQMAKNKLTHLRRIMNGN